MADVEKAAMEPKAPKVAKPAKLTHPDLEPRVSPRAINAKRMRRTTVRTAKLINVEASHRLGMIQTNQVPIEPSHNNHGNLDDPSQPLRHYLNKGWRFPHEVVEDLLAEGLKWPEGKPVPSDFIYCALMNCWEPALKGGERCAECEDAWQRGWIRYATRHK